MNLLLIGGHTRSIGKSALVVDIIRAFPGAAWTAVKITQYGHGVCSINGAACGCAPEHHPFSLDEEGRRDDRTDTSRFLVAGAARSLWLRSKQGRLADALPLLDSALHGAGNVIVESNSLRGFRRPLLYLMVLDPSKPDFKTSAREFLGCADAFVLRSAASNPGAVVPPQLLAARPVFLQSAGEPLPAGLVRLLEERYFHPVPEAAHADHLSS